MSSSLYPPVIATYMPAFTDEDECRVYFNLSDYQGEEPPYVHVIVNDQRTNATALKTSAYPLGLMQRSWQHGYDYAEEGTPQFNANQYYITIDNSDLEGGFKYGEYYRVQLRFSSQFIDVTSADNVTRNLDNFSEWSTICLIKKIHKPTIYINGTEINSIRDLSVATNFYNISGSVYFSDGDDESLKKVHIDLLQKVDDVWNLLDETDITDINRYSLDDSFIYKFPIKLENNGHYEVVLTSLSRGLYEEIDNYEFDVSTSSTQLDTATLTIEPDIDNGCMKITIENLDTGDGYDNFILLRSDSNSLFKIWEEVQIIALTKATSFSFYDKTIEADVFYKYDLQLAPTSDTRGGTLETPPQEQIVPYDEIYLTTDSKQLRITLNNNISSFKYNVQETKTDTIGSKFPWIRRNAHSYYRSFSLSGTIAYIGNNENILYTEDQNYMTDDERRSLQPWTTTGFIETNKAGMFETRESLINRDSTVTTLYNNYNLKNGIDDTNDIYLERKFREAVIEFLYNSEVKLYRSRTEGLILVRLMNVNLTPKNELGKFIYDFSCEAIEIDDCNKENFNKYNIQNIGKFVNAPRQNYGYNHSYMITRVGGDE